MRSGFYLKLTVLLLIFWLLNACNNTPKQYTIDKDTQFGWLAELMDKYHKTFDVYTDVGAAGNHFLVKAKMWGYGTEDAVEMDECSTGQLQAHNKSATSIKATFKARESNWGGFYFMNGVFRPGDVEPRPNWGDEPNAGFNLTGATRVTFFARGEKGGENVEFFVGGVGWPNKPYKESLRKVPIKLILTKKWKQYSINLSGKDLSYVLSGFGWVANAPDNFFKDIVFYIDDIRWEKERLDDLRFLVSYETKPSQDNFDVVMRNVAFTYDNALALLAFLARGNEDDLKRARILANSLVHAVNNDRFYTDGRLRNAYMGGDLILFPGWTPNGREKTARIPGFWDCNQKKWFEDKFLVSTHTGNVAWTMIALISAYERFKSPEYLSAAERLGEWVEANTRDHRGAGGYTGGFEGWEPNPQKLLYKSTEHNLDLYVAFLRLYEITKEIKWKDRALHAKRFVQAMWDNTEGKFWTGTTEDGKSINKDVVPLDVQAWAILAFHDEAPNYLRALEYAENHHAVSGGFDFDTDRDGIWYEGTAQMAVAYNAVGEGTKARNLLTVIERAALPGGAIPAASKDGLTTGFDWLYYRRGHVGATAWYIFGKLGVNPYWLK